MLRPTTFFVTVMLTIGSFKVFDLILVMTEGGPGQSTLVLSQYIYGRASPTTSGCLAVSGSFCIYHPDIGGLEFSSRVPSSVAWCAWWPTP